jgi:hypothetical protein
MAAGYSLMGRPAVYDYEPWICTEDKFSTRGVSAKEARDGEVMVGGLEWRWKGFVELRKEFWVDEMLSSKVVCVVWSWL